MYRSKFCCRAVSVALLLINSASRAQITFNVSTVAAPGEAVPVPSELVFATQPSVNDSGQVAFYVDGGLLLHSNGQTTIVAAFGDPAPGGGTFIGAGGALINASGQIVFSADVTAPGRPGIFLWSNGSTQLIVRDGDPAPGGGTFTLSYEYSLNELGEIAFGAYTPSREEMMLFLFSQGTVSLLARTGDPAPRGGAFLTLYHPVINANRQVAFESDLDSLEFGIFLRDPDGSMIEVVRDGDPAPGGGAPLYPVSAEINDAGAVAFSAYSSIFGDGGIFLFSNGAITRQVRENDPAPGGGGLLTPYGLSFNSAGQIAFMDPVNGGPDGIFLSSGGTVSEVARIGGRSPEGDAFTRFGYDPPSLNAAGQVTFSSELQRSLGGIYLFTNGNVARIAGQGDPVDREPRLLDAHPEAINDAGEVAFRGGSFPGQQELFLGASSAPIARFGESALQGGVFNFFLMVAIDGSAQTIFQASTSGGFSGVYSRSEGVLNRIVGTGDPAPGGQFSAVNEASINNAGDIALIGYGNFALGPVVFVLSGGEFHRLVGAGDPAPGGGVFSFFANVSINDAGQVAFMGYAYPRPRQGIFLWSDGNIVSIAQTGDPAPGGGTFYIPGPTFPRRYVPSLNAMGQIVFGARLSSPTGNSAVFLYSADGLRRIAGPGDPAPGGGIFVRARSASLNDLGEVAFAASLNPSGSGVYLVSQGTMNKIVATGDPAPSGGTFSQLDTTKINSRSQVAFEGSTDQFSTPAVYLATPVR